MNVSGRRSSDVGRQKQRVNDEIETFDGDDLPLDDLVTASQFTTENVMLRWPY
jgi:hypothetical protein